MKISDIPVETGERYELVSITNEVRQAVRDAGVDEGTKSFRQLLHAAPGDLRVAGLVRLEVQRQ